MQKRLIPAFLVILILAAATLVACTSHKSPDPVTVTPENQSLYGVYLGIEDYGHIHARNAEHFRHRFFIKGAEYSFRIPVQKGYALQNTLAEGYVYDLVIENDELLGARFSVPYAEGPLLSKKRSSFTIGERRVMAGAPIYEIRKAPGGALVSEVPFKAGQRVKAYGVSGEFISLAPAIPPYNAPVYGVPGLRTLKNFLATAMEPVGVTLYVLGGGWNWADVGASPQATSFGLAQTWLDFFHEQDTSYTFKNTADPRESYYPMGCFNQYSHIGLDCSGFLGWVLYNVLNTTNTGKGYVQGSTRMAKNLAEKNGYGFYSRDTRSFRPGDIFSMYGHVWICLGVCNDGSLVIIHATPSDSKSGHPGGGVQLSALGWDEDCEAYQLVKEYMTRYYPKWCKRYTPVFREFDEYTKMKDRNAGKFSWYLDERGLADPDHYTDMSAREILEDLFRGVPHQNR